MHSAREMIVEGKAEPGDTVDLLWRDKLGDPFTQRIIFNDAPTVLGFLARSVHCCAGKQQRSAAVPE